MIKATGNIIHAGRWIEGIPEDNIIWNETIEDDLDKQRILIQSIKQFGIVKKIFTGAKRYGKPIYDAYLNDCILA